MVRNNMYAVVVIITIIIIIHDGITRIDVLSTRKCLASNFEIKR